MENLEPILAKLGITPQLLDQQNGEANANDLWPAEATSVSKLPTKLIGRNEPEWWARAMRLDVTHHELVKKLALFAGSFLSAAIRNEFKGTRWLVIFGSMGTGKSHASRWLVRAFNDWIWDFILDNKTKWFTNRKPHATMLNWSRFCVREEKGENESTLRDYLESDLIVLDDVGAEADRFKSGAHKANLRDFLEDCRQKWLILNTNIAREQWPDVFGPRVADRLDGAKHCNLTGMPTYRRKQCN